MTAAVTRSSKWFETTSRWLNLTFALSALTVIMSGASFLLTSATTFTITPLTLFLHLVWALCVSAWILNLKIKISPDKKPLVAVATVVAIGSIWSSLQQWLAYQQNGTVNDLTFIVGAMLMDVIGGIVMYVLYNVNAIRGQNTLSR